MPPLSVPIFSILDTLSLLTLPILNTEEKANHSHLSLERGIRGNVTFGTAAVWWRGNGGEDKRVERAALGCPTGAAVTQRTARFTEILSPDLWKLQSPRPKRTPLGELKSGRKPRGALDFASDQAVRQSRTTELTQILKFVKYHLSSCNISVNFIKYKLRSSTC